MKRALQKHFYKQVGQRGNEGSLSYEVWLFFISKTHGFLGARPDGIITDQEESAPGVVEFKYIQVKPGETLTDVLLRQHKVQHKGNEIIQLNKTPNINYSYTSKCLSENINEEFL